MLESVRARRGSARVRSLALLAFAVAAAVLSAPAQAPAADWSGDHQADVLVIDTSGRLIRYRGNGIGTWVTGSEEQMGCCGWRNYTAVVEANDFSGDGNPDLLVRKTDGSLQIYRGNGAGEWATGSEELLGCCGWNDATAIVAPGDFDGDHHPDLIARMRDGSLQLYRGDSNNGFLDSGTPHQIGCCSWNDAKTVIAPGDFNTDGNPDLLGVMSDGRLMLYAGDGTGHWLNNGEGQQIGCCTWNQLNSITSPGDFNGDGHPDVLATQSDGSMQLYRGNGQGGWMSQTPTQIGCCGWNNYYAVASFTLRNAGLLSLNGVLGIAQDTAASAFPLFSHNSFAPLVNARPRFRLIADWDAAMPAWSCAWVLPGDEQSRDNEVARFGSEGELSRVRSLVDGAPAGTEIIVTLRQRRPSKCGGHPSNAEYDSGLTALITALGQSVSKVGYWGVLNEPNLTWSSGGSGPGIVAGYYKTLVNHAGIGVGRVIGPDFVDVLPPPNGARRDVSTLNPVDPDLGPWVANYRTAVLANGAPGNGFGHAAAFHPYGAITRRKVDAINAYMDALPSGTNVWLTEGGALRSGVQRNDNGTVTPYTVYVDNAVVGDGLQDAQIQFLMINVLGHLRHNGAVERLYYYALRDDPNYDTGLLDISGNRRPAWNTFCQYACLR